MLSVLGADMKAVLAGFLTSAVLLATPSLASEQNFDGNWQGEGSSSSQECPVFDFEVTVQDDKVQGTAHQTGTEYHISGLVTDQGDFTGTVKYMWFEIAELTGDIEGEHGAGEWRALKGPDCEGEFSVKKM